MTSSQRRQARVQSPTKSLRQQTRQTRALQKRRQTLYVILAVVGVVLVGAAIAILASINNASKQLPVVAITPLPRPQANATAMGDPNAPVKIDVWEDFQCPACLQFTQVVERQIAETWVKDGQAYYVFHHYPFLEKNVGGKESSQAANASMCANEQERFWDYHDMLFANWNGENQGAFSDERLKTFAEKLGLDMSAFKACFAENRYKVQIDTDYQAGLANKVTGTPSVFVDGVLLTPGLIPSYDDVKTAVDAALAAKK